MKLNIDQQKKVEANLGLVGKVIKDKLHKVGQSGFCTYDDLFQIGCIGLSKAAATDKGRVFSTYAYRLIWDEICDALIYASRRMSNEDISDAVQHAADETSQSYSDIKVDLYSVIEAVKKTATPSLSMGIDALLLMNDGYTAKDCYYVIGDNYLNSYDSKYLDEPFVCKNNIIAKVIIGNSKKILKNLFNSKY